MNKNLHNRKQKGQGLVEYALILVLVAVVVIAVLLILGPVIGNVFTKVNTNVASAGGVDLPVAAPTTVVVPTPTANPATNAGCAAVHADGYATGPGYGWNCWSPSFGHYDIP